MMDSSGSRGTARRGVRLGRGVAWRRGARRGEVGGEEGVGDGSCVGRFQGRAAPCMSLYRGCSPCFRLRFCCLIN